MPIELTNEPTSRPLRKVALIYNPVSGQWPERRAALVATIGERLGRAGIEVEIWPTDGPCRAIELTRQAVEQGVDAVLACGGDGTAHEAVQGLAGTEVPLGVIPQGTGNLLAVNVGLGHAPLRALERILQGRVVRVPLGRIWFQDAGGQRQSRYFLTVAGVGPDALFLAGSSNLSKRFLGYARYVVEAFRVWWGYTYPLYAARVTVAGEAEALTGEYSQLLAVRIRNFGPALHDLAPGAALGSTQLRLVAFATRRRRDFLRFFAEAVLLRRARFGGRVHLLDADAVECLPLAGTDRPVYVEADGEVLGTLPGRLEMTGECVSLLVAEGIQFSAE